MRIVLTGGVTGGHIYPALAIGDKFRAEDPSADIIYIASGEPLEKDIIPAHDYTLYEVDSCWLDRRDPVKLARTLRRTLRGRREAYRIMKRFRPDAVISTGSYVSVPIVLAARGMRIPVFLHEQNGFPGVSNRLASRTAEKVFLGFASAKEYFSDKADLVVSGNPVRQDFAGRDRSEDRKALGIPEDDLVIMVFGGSLGSETTNLIGEAAAREYAGKKGYTVIWGTGKEYYDEIKERLSKEGFAPENVRISPFITDMPAILSAADICVSRSGALSTAETTMAGRAAIFIPSPNVTADHQYYNAKAVADVGGAVIVRDNEETAEKVMAEIKRLDGDREAIRSMEKASSSVAPVDAADIIYSNIMESLKQQLGR